MKPERDPGKASVSAKLALKLIREHTFPACDHASAYECLTWARGLARRAS